jgi:hypothetical protein
VLGVTIGAYQGNSTLEKYSKAKYQYEQLNSSCEVPEEEQSANG